MYYDEHNPPHFYVEYNGNNVSILIDEVKVLKGAFPSKQLKLILAWCILHHDELIDNWNLAKNGKLLIVPLM